MRDSEKECEEWQARRAVSDMVGLLLESHIRGLVDDLEPVPEPWLCASLHPRGPPSSGSSHDSSQRRCLPGTHSKRQQAPTRGFVSNRGSLCCVSAPSPFSHAAAFALDGAEFERRVRSVGRACWNSLDALGCRSLLHDLQRYPGSPFRFGPYANLAHCHRRLSRLALRHDDYCPPHTSPQSVQCEHANYTFRLCLAFSPIQKLQPTPACMPICFIVAAKSYLGLLNNP